MVISPLVFDSSVFIWHACGTFHVVRQFAPTARSRLSGKWNNPHTPHVPDVLALLIAAFGWRRGDFRFVEANFPLRKIPM